MYIPQNAEILLSVINTLLRDKYSSIYDLCDYEDVDFNLVNFKLESIGYFYNEKTNSYILKD